MLQTNLSVCKDGGIVSLKAAFDQPLGAVLVDGFLLSVYVKHVVIGEGLVLAQDHLGLARHHKGADVAALDLLFGQLRTDPAEQRKQMERKSETGNTGIYKQDTQNHVCCFELMANMLTRQLIQSVGLAGINFLLSRID